MSNHDLGLITKHYLIAALWSSTGGTEEESYPLDDVYSIADFPKTVYEEAYQEVKDFTELAGDLLDGMDPEMIGHDFWLTRNGHGTGFWDRGLGDIGDELTTHTKSFGSSDVLEDAEGGLYLS